MHSSQSGFSQRPVHCSGFSQKPDHSCTVLISQDSVRNRSTTAQFSSVRIQSETGPRLHVQVSSVRDRSTAVQVSSGRIQSVTHILLHRFPPGFIYKAVLRCTYFGQGSAQNLCFGHHHQGSITEKCSVSSVLSRGFS